MDGFQIELRKREGGGSGQGVATWVALGMRIRRAATPWRVVCLGGWAAGCAATAATLQQGGARSGR